MAQAGKKDYLARMRDGEPLRQSERIMMIVRLSIPAILAQISSIVMQYIDASMVGSLGARDSASIGLVSSSTWLFYGLCMAAGTGFTVQIAKRAGAKDWQGARSLVRSGLICVLIFSAVLLVVGASISAFLPAWLGGEESIRQNASIYFLVFALSLPFVQLNSTAAGMIQCSGNMRLPGILEIVMCVLDVLFNALLIFPSGVHEFLGARIFLPGAGLGLLGAALGTALSEVVISLFLLYYLLFRSRTLSLRAEEKTAFSAADLRAALKIAVPVAVEQVITCSAYIAFTRIVSPLGSVAIAANSFAITAESLCYMPGYGIGSAATTVIGQSIGARRRDLTLKLGRLSALLGIAMMTASGFLMYLFAPQMIGILSPDEHIRELGTAILRIEAFAEPMYAAAIVINGVFRGAGETKIPTVLNFVSMWLVRIPLAAVLAGFWGLPGVWFAMCTELIIRGILFIVMLETRFRKKWG